MPVEFLLLLAPVDVQLARMRILADPRRPAVGLDLLDSESAEIRLDFRHPGARGAFALARGRQPRPRRLDESRELAIAPREKHFLPAAQLVAQSFVPPRLRRLPLQRAALLIHLEDDVVNAREVLLRGDRK